MHQSKNVSNPVPPAEAHAYLTTHETARRTRLGKSTLDKWRVKGDGPPFIKVGKKVLYRVGDLDTWLAGRRVTSTTEADARGLS